MREYSFLIEYKKNIIPDYEKKMLVAGDCDFFLPMSFVSEDNMESAYYDCSGYMPISHCHNMSALQMLSCMEEVLKSLAQAGEYLIKPENINLNCNTVYKKVLGEEIKIAYVPTRTPGETVADHIGIMVEELSGHCVTKEQTMYLEKIKECARENMAIQDILRLIGAYKREVRLCGFV